MDTHIRWRTGPGKTDKLDMEAWTRKQIKKCKGDEVLSAEKCCPPNSDVSMCFNEHSIYCACTSENVGRLFPFHPLDGVNKIFYF